MSVISQRPRDPKDRCPSTTSSGRNKKIFFFIYHILVFLNVHPTTYNQSTTSPIL